MNLKKNITFSQDGDERAVSTSDGGHEVQIMQVTFSIK